MEIGITMQKMQLLTIFELKLFVETITTKFNKTAIRNALHS